MPETTSPRYSVPMQEAVNGARNGAVSTAVNATGSTDVKGIKDVYDAATKAHKFGNKINEIDEREPADIGEALRNFRPAGDLADLIGSVPILGKAAIGFGPLKDALDAVQDMIDDFQDFAETHNPFDDPPAPPPPPPPPGPGNGSPWGPGGRDGPDPFFSPPHDPLVLDLDGGGITLVGVAASTADFDLDGNGFTERTGWVGPGEGFLALDANLNGVIDDVSELFGDADTDGFDELAALDLNADGVIDANDAVYASLRLWVDADGDGVTDAGELQTLAAHGVTSISLGYAANGAVVEGNLVARTGTFETATGGGATATVWFATNQLMSEYILPPGFVFDSEALLLPNLQGYGGVPDLRVAMTQNADLRGLVADLVNDSAGLSAADLRGRVLEIVVEWSGVGPVADGSRGPYVDALTLEVLEAFYGSDFTFTLTANFGAALEELFGQLVDHMALRLLPQIPLSDVLLHHNPAEEALANPFWSFAGAFDEDTGAFAFDLGAIVERMMFELRMYHAEAPMAFVSQVAPWLAVLKDEVYAGDEAAFGTALRYFLMKEGHDNALTVAIYAAATGVNIVVPGGDGQVSEGSDLIFVEAGELADGGDGDDSYAVEYGSHVRIADAGSGFFSDSLDDAVLIRGFVADEAVFALVGSQLLITFPGSPDSSIVIDMAAGQGEIERFVFADRALSLAEVLIRTIADATSQADILRGSSFADVLDGQAGADLLIGGRGDDEYVFGVGSGGDVVVETAGEGTDLIRLGDGVLPTDVVFERTGDDLLVRIGSGGDILTVRGWFAGATIEAFRFEDDTVLTAAQVNALVTPGSGVTINGTGDDDSLLSGAGHDRLVGGAGSDTYVYEAGDGFDVIADGASLADNAASSDTLVLEGLTLADVQFGRITAAYGGHLTIDILGAQPGRITVEKGLNFGDIISGRIERFVFEDVTLTLEQVIAILMAQAQTDGDDVIPAWDTRGVYEGGLGNDVIQGYGEADTYVWSAGDGRDIIYNATGGTLVLHGVSPEDMIVRPSGTGSGDVEISLGGSGAQAIVISGQSLGRMYSVRFDDGTVWDQAELVLRMEGPLSSTPTVTGSTGADALVGASGDDVFDAGEGDDRMEGLYGSDHYLYRSGQGNDVIREWGAGASIDVDALTLVDLTAQDIRAERVGDDLVILVLATSETITVEEHFIGQDRGLERIHFADGETWRLHDIALNAPIRGTAGDDILASDVSTDGPYYGDHQVFEGGGGADDLYGGKGDDVYLWRTGDGDDAIHEGTGNVFERKSVDELFLVDVDPGDVILSWEGLALVVNIVSTGERILVSNQAQALYPGDANVGYGIERLRFADGTTWDQAEIAARTAIRGDASDQSLYGSDRGETLIGGLGDDRLLGDAGSDTYVYADGDGWDLVFEEEGGAGDADQLLLSGLSLADVVFTIDGEDLVVTTPSGQSVTVAGQFGPEFSGSGAPGRGLERIVFADGVLDGRAAILAAALAGQFESVAMGGADADALEVEGGPGFLSGEAGDDQLTGAAGGDWLRGGLGADLLAGAGGRDRLDGGDGDDVLDGGSQADDLRGGAGDDVITGGLGADRMEGDLGSDVYLIGPGAGEDEIVDLGDAEDTDRIVFDAGVDPQDVTLSREGANLVLSAATAAGISRVVVTSQFQGAGIEEIRFGEATVWDRAYIEATILAESQTAGNDTILGYQGDDILEGGAGDDYIDGGLGDDTLLFGLGDGQDWIDEASGTDDRLILGIGLDQTGLTVTRVGDEDSVLLSFATGESVTLYRQLAGFSYGSEYGVEQIIFSDLSFLTRNDLADMILAASVTAGDDVIQGFDRDDSLTGGGGSDLFVFSSDFGDDVITDFDPVVDRIEFADWMFSSFADLDGLASQSGADVVIETDYGSITLRNVDLNQLSEANFKFGALGDDVLVGGAGDDYLEGGAGDDTYLVNTGVGEDVIIDEEGADDQLILGPGLTVAGMTVERLDDGYDSVRLVFANGQSVTLDSQLWGLGSGSEWGVERIVFDDSTVLTKADLADMLLTYTAGADHIRGFDRDDLLTGGGGDDLFVFATEAFGDDVITDFSSGDRIEFADWIFSDLSAVLAAASQDGADVVISTDYGSIRLQGVLIGDLTVDRFRFGNLGDDVLTGGPGGDFLDGGDGDDIYHIGPGGGEDYVTDGAGAFDRIVFGAGLSHATMVVTREGGSVRLEFATGERVHLDGELIDFGRGGETGVEFLEFSDATVLTRADLAQRILDSETTSGSDVITGFSSDDFLIGGAGADVFLFAEGDFGSDTVLDFNPLEDRLQFEDDLLEDFQAALLGAFQDGDDVVIDTGAGTVRLADVSLVDLNSDMFIFS